MRLRLENTEDGLHYYFHSNGQYKNVLYKLKLMRIFTKNKVFFYLFI